MKLSKRVIIGTTLPVLRGHRRYHIDTRLGLYGTTQSIPEDVVVDDGDSVGAVTGVGTVAGAGEIVGTVVVRPQSMLDPEGDNVPLFLELL